MRFIVVALALLMSLFSATSHAWWNDDWAGRKKITLTNPAGEVADAPVLIRLHTGNFDFLSANENGSNCNNPARPASDWLMLDIKPNCCDPVRMNSPIRLRLSTTPCR